MTILTPEQRQAVERAGAAPVRITDPESNTAYVLLRADLYERLRALVDPGEAPNPETMYPFIDYGL